MLTRSQTKIAQSRWTLPATAIYVALLCVFIGMQTSQLWGQVLLLGLSTLMLVELNNANSLIRIYSRMVSCSFLVMIIMSNFVIADIVSMAVVTAFVGFYLCFFKAYQNPTATNHIFFAFFALGIASIAFAQVLFLLPILWILLATNVMAFSARTFFATLLGIASPYWFAAAYFIYVGDLSFFPRHFIELIQVGPMLDFTTIDEHRIVTAIFVAALAIIGATHFLMYSYLDKIRTRMIYEVFIVIDLCCFCLIILQPQHFDRLLGLAILTTSPLIGHYLALSHTKISNICFYAIIVLALIITFYNLWMPLTIFS